MVSASEYLAIMKTIPIKQRSVIKESRTFKIYLPSEYDDLWSYLHANKKRVDIIVFLPRTGDCNMPEIMKFIDKIVMKNRRIVKERMRYKIYLSKKLNDVWKYVHDSRLKIDVIVITY